MADRIQAERVTTETYRLGEGIIWDERLSRVLWVDIEAGCVLSSPFDGSPHLSPSVLFQSDRSVGFVALTEADGLICGEEDRIVHVAADGTRAVVATLPELRPGCRINDGIIDGSGRIVFGTLSRDGGEGSEHLAVVDARGTRILRRDLALSNGLALLADGRLFHVDTLTRTVWVQEADSEEWAVAFTTTGYPDGMCSDAGGHLWIAMWGDGEVRRYTPDGALVSSIAVPAPNVSSVCFAGPELDQLLITTATQDLSEEILVRWPQSGSVFLARPEAQGLPAARWGTPRA